MEKEETNALERLDGDDGNDDDRADEKNTNPLALAPTTLSTTTNTNTPTPTAVGETLVGQTAKSAQIDLWLQQTLSNLPVQSWNVTSLGGNAEKGTGTTTTTTASFERMAIAPERVEALNGPIMRVDRIDGETVDVNMNLHFRAHFGKGQLENSTTSLSNNNNNNSIVAAAVANPGGSANFGAEDRVQKKGGSTLALGEKAHDTNDASGSSPRLVELRGDDEEFHAATTTTTMTSNISAVDTYASPVDGRYAVARYDGDIEDGESRGFLYSEYKGNNDNNNNNGASTSEQKTNALSEEFRIDAKNVRLLERIAVGGFAEVFRGSYQGTLVAVKQLLERGKSVREKLENEVQTLARLRHPNLLLFMGYALEPPLILTEFMRRGSLHGILKSDECFKVDGLRCLNITMAVARGMHYLHTRSPPILHLDLKSPNILVDEKWRVKIADFGMSRVRFSTLASARSEFHGTPEWMAPEMLRAEPYDERADIYSFGVVCWELLTTRTPWDDLHPMQVVAVVGYSERRLALPTDWNKRREALVGASSQRQLPLTQTDELAFDSISNLFETCAAKDVEARPKSFEFILRSLETEMNAWRRSLPSPSPGNDKKVETGKQEENPKSDENGLKERE